jgi:serine/threonine protein kinase
VSRPDDVAETTLCSLVRGVALAPALAPGTLVGLRSGDVVDQFRIDAELGRGGMGVVYRATDLQLGREVALKVMRVDRWPLHAVPQVAEIFEREGRATARLNHPGIVTLHHAGESEGVLFLVLELLRGETLVTRLERGALPAEEALRVAADVADALAHAHGHGILHRDLKPANVFVTNGGRIKLLDFGLASLDAMLAAPDGVAAMSRAGTPGYMAPEQWLGTPQDARTDLWAAGMLLAQMASGRAPPTPKDADAVRAGLPVPLGAEIDAEVRAIVATATAWDPVDRFADAAALAPAITAAVRRRRRRRLLRTVGRAGLAVAAVAVVALLLDAAPWRSRPSYPTIGEGLWEATPREGSPWRGTLRRLAADRYQWTYTDAPDGAVPSRDHTLHQGVLALRRDRDGWVLGGHVHDLAGWCCGFQGELEFEVDAASPDRMHQRRSVWGDAAGHYQYQFDPWWFERVGPLPERLP